MAKKTLVDKTSHKLKKYIADKSLVPGDKLPNEYELSTILDAGRNTVREAVRVLAARNILTIKQGAGTFIADNTGIIDDPLGFSFTSDQDKLVKDLMELRLMVEPKIAALAAENASEEQITQLKVITEEIEMAIENKEDFSSLDKDFHSHISNICGNSVIATLIPIIAEGVTVYAEAVDEQEYHQTKISHRSILEAIKSRKAAEAENAMRFHLLYNKYRY